MEFLIAFGGALIVAIAYGIGYYQGGKYVCKIFRQNDESQKSESNSK